MKILRARHVYSPGSPTVENGAVAIQEGKIVEAGKWPLRGWTGEVEDLGEVILMPGLINAHCHLDYTLFRSAIGPQKSFADWIRRINALKASVRDEEYLSSIQRGFNELITYGTTSVLNIEAFPELLPLLPPPPIRTWWFWELLDIRSRIETEKLLQGVLHLFDRRTQWLGGCGLSPHAPYTASIPLYKLASQCAQLRQLPFTTHVAESREEYAMFAQASGTLYEFLSRIGRDMSDCDGRTPLGHLITSDALPPHAILAHVNEVADSDYELLARWGKPLHVVHCPKSHHFFQHTRFPYEALRKAGVNIVLGTDSLASNDSLNLFAEMRTFHHGHPDVPIGEILRMVTTAAAEALQMPEKLGQIRSGAHADLISIPFDGNENKIEEAILAHRSPIAWMIVAGETCSALQKPLSAA
jgi:cytosine/adenosine deaminase-related metal-dependent hydrolase